MKSKRNTSHQYKITDEEVQNKIQEKNNILERDLLFYSSGVLSMFLTINFTTLIISFCVSGGVGLYYYVWKSKRNTEKVYEEYNLK